MTPSQAHFNVEEAGSIYRDIQEISFSLHRELHTLSILCKLDIAKIHQITLLHHQGENHI